LGDPGAIVGRGLNIDGRPHTVVGVLPRGFDFPQQPGIQVLVPYALNDVKPETAAHFLRVLGRMAPGVTLEEARTEMTSLAANLERESPASNRGWTVALDSLHTAVVGDVTQTLYLLLGAAGLLLLITCANVAGLLLARSQTRAPELAVRAALGAGGRRIARQLVTESAVLSALGGVGGLVLASTGINALLAVQPAALPRASEVVMDARILLVVIAICAATAAFFGVLPWLVHSSRVELRDDVAGAGRTPRRSGRAARRVLVVGEIALALSIAVGAVLLVQNLFTLQRIDPGFATSGVLSMGLRPPAGTYDDPAVRTRMYRRVVETLSTIPGTQVVGAAHRLPLAGNSAIPFVIAGKPPASGQPPSVNYRSVAGDYFGALSMTIIQGRTFTDAEMWDIAGPQAVIVNRAAVAEYFDGADPLTQQLVGPGKRLMTVVGVVEDVREGALDGAPEPAMYLPYAKYPVPALTLLIRSASDQVPLAKPALDALRQLDPALAPGQLRTLDAFLSDVVAGPRFSAMLLTIFAAIALLLAAVGVYAITAFTVAQRTSEIGVRVALGATPLDVFRTVVLPGIQLAALGTIAGLGCAALGSRMMGGLLLGVDARQPMVFAATAAGLFVVATMATLIPARRAMRIDPVVALRQQ
jgi:predicted permease